MQLCVANLPLYLQIMCIQVLFWRYKLQIWVPDALCVSGWPYTPDPVLESETAALRAARIPCCQGLAWNCCWDHYETIQCQFGLGFLVACFLFIIFL